MSCRPSKIAVNRRYRPFARWSTHRQHALVVPLTDMPHPPVDAPPLFPSRSEVGTRTSAGNEARAPADMMATVEQQSDVDIPISQVDCPLSPTPARKRRGRPPSVAGPAGARKRKARPRTKTDPPSHLLPQNLLPEQDLPTSVWSNIAARLANRDGCAASRLAKLAGES